MAILIRQTEWVTFNQVPVGTVNEVMIDIKPVVVGRDSLGRSRIGGYDVKASFNVMDCDKPTIDSLIDKGPVTLQIGWEQNAEQFYMTGVIPIIETMQIDGDGKASKIKVMADKIMKGSEVKTLLGDL